MKKIFTLLFLFTTIFAFGQAESNRPAKYYDVTITNITKGQTFSPSVVVVHPRNQELFSLGEPASEALAILAEEGNGVPLQEDALSKGAFFADITDGLLNPGESVTIRVSSNRQFNRISVVAMLVTTNDGFWAINGEPLPFTPYFKKSSHSKEFLANVFDSGTEANTEDCDHIPIPCGSFGVRMTEGAEGFVHVHSGFHGIGDLDQATYDWRNPAARITITPVR